MGDDNTYHHEYHIDFNDENYLTTMQNMLNDLEYFGLNINNTNSNQNQNQNNSSPNNTNRYVIEFAFDIPNFIENNENIPNYFKNIKEINDTIGKPIYINKKDECLNKECLICLEKFEYKKYKRILPCCKNVYHKTCIDKWLKKNSSCPNCRHDFLEKKEESEENDENEDDNN